MIKVSAIILALSIAFSGAALAQGQGKNKNKGGKKGGTEFQMPSADDTFKYKAVSGPIIGSRDIDTIRRFDRTNPGRVGGGKSKALPPGIAKNLARGKPMPPGIAKTRFPGGLNSLLPSYPGLEWSLLGNDVALVNATTNVIVDLFRDIF